MNDFIFAGMLASISRFISLRKKAKQKDKSGIEIHLPEWIKFLILYVIMFVWIKFVDLVFYILFGV